MQPALITTTVLAYITATILFPVTRHRWVHGSWPVAFHHDADPFQRLLGALLGLLLAAGAAWAALVGTGIDLAIWSTPSWLGWLGLALLIAGGALELSGQLSMGASFRVGVDTDQTELVTGGLFALTRNPVFTGLLLAVTGLVLITPSGWTVMGLAWIASLIAIQVRLEEAHLVRSHGAAYLTYASRVGRFWPGLGRLRERPELQPGAAR